MVSAAMKVVPALAAGNTVVLKPAELAPLGALRFAELCLEAGIPPGVLNVVPGGAEAGAALVGDAASRQDQLHGRRATARRIIEAAARNLTPVVLELGGKSAELVFADADLDRRCRHVGADRRSPTPAVRVACCRPGCSCTTPCTTRWRRRWRRWPQALARRPPVRRRCADGSGDRRRQLRADPRRDRAAAASGGSASLLTGGERVGGELADGYFVAPTVFGDVDNASDARPARDLRAGAVDRRGSPTRTRRSRSPTAPTTGSAGSCSRATSTAPTASPSGSTPATSGINAFPPMPPNAPFGGDQGERLRPRGRPARGSRSSSRSRTSSSDSFMRRRLLRRRPRRSSGRAVQRRHRRAAPRRHGRRRDQGRVARPAATTCATCSARSRRTTARPTSRSTRTSAASRSTCAQDDGREVFWRLLRDRRRVRRRLRSAGAVRRLGIGYDAQRGPQAGHRLLPLLRVRRDRARTRRSRPTAR